MDKFTTAGKIQHHGVSVEKVEEALMAIEYPNVKTIQLIFNMFRHRPSELFFGEARRRQVGIIARVPLASGMLSGKLTAQSQFATDDHRNFNRQGQAFDRGETFSQRRLCAPTFEPLKNFSALGPTEQRFRNWRCAGF